MLEEDGCQETAARVGETFIRGMMSLRDEFEVVGDVRGKGLLLGMELVKNRVRNSWSGNGMRCEREGYCLEWKLVRNKVRNSCSGSVIGLERRPKFVPKG